jgi:hypothetical protein
MSAAAPVMLHVRPAIGHVGGPLISVITPLPAGAHLPEALSRRLPTNVEIIVAEGGSRAAAMNAGAARATGSYLWFVHADTTISDHAVNGIRAAAIMLDDQISYCDIRFDSGGIMRLTDLGVAFRSRVMGLPFGDQALGMPATLFHGLGGYREDAPYGEDHLLVWCAHQRDIPVKPLGATVGTSAQKYRQRGWLPMTLRHLWLTIRQAWPEWRAMRQARRARRRNPDAASQSRNIMPTAP